MSNDRYANALAELKAILDNSEDKIIKKIPNSFIMFVEENYDKNYFCSIKSDISISNQNILEETKYLIALVYRSYLCNENERQKYDKILQENENNYQKGLHEKYNIDIFHNRKQENQVNEEVNLSIEIKKENYLKKIINKIKKYIYEWRMK